MALQASPEASRGVFDAIKGALGLFSDTNKQQAVIDNSNPIPADEYESKLKEEDIVKLVGEWRKTYAVYYADIDRAQKLAFDYWIGKQKLDEITSGQMASSSASVVDNQIFASLETFLPIATRANPDPMVQADPGDVGQQIAKAIKAALVNEADKQKLRRKLARLTRHWAIYLVGVAKISWDVSLKRIVTDIVNPRKIIFDKDGFIDEGGHFIGEYIGEKKKATADRLCEMFPKKASDITKKVQGKMATKLEYFEWWYKGDDLFYTLDDIVLGKFKNPNWNYDTTTQGPDPLTGEMSLQPVEGVNHLQKREAPYVFLSVFSAGLHPHDDTSLILQNVSIQDMVNKRLRQIDRNVDGMNNGLLVSGKSFTEDQAAGAAAALRQGKAIRVPEGDVERAAKRFPPNSLPADVFQNLQDARNELRSIFGTSGSTPEGTRTEDTVRGKILVQQQDGSRIGGGITEQIEQVADTIYNWWVQFMFVYWDEEHFILASDTQGGMEMMALKNAHFPLLKSLDITVKEGSLIPKDPLTQRNEAIDLWSANAIDPLNFYKKLDFPDPAQATQQLILWQMLQKGMIQPQQYLPSFQVPTNPMGQQPMPNQMPGTGGPAVSPPQNQGVNNPASPPSEEAQAQQLIQSIPIPR